MPPGEGFLETARSASPWGCLRLNSSPAPLPCLAVIAHAVNLESKHHVIRVVALKRGWVYSMEWRDTPLALFR